MFLGTLDTTLLENMLSAITGKGAIRAGEGTCQNF